MNPIPSIPTDIRQNNPIPEKFNADIIVQSTLRKPFVWLLKFPLVLYSRKNQPILFLLDFVIKNLNLKHVV